MGGLYVAVVVVAFFCTAVTGFFAGVVDFFMVDVIGFFAIVLATGAFLTGVTADFLGAVHGTAFLVPMA